MIKTTRWDAAEHLNTPESISEFLEAACEDNDPEFIRHSISAVSRSRGRAQMCDREFAELL